MVTAHGNGSFQEQLHVLDDPASGLRGIIAIHSTALGPAAGGCRFWHYADQAALAADAVRLARGMSYKNALAGLPFGGGKAVLQRPEGAFDRTALFRAFGEAVARLNGTYVTAEDVGTTIADMTAVRSRTLHVAGQEAHPGRAGGDPSPWTALGVFLSMQEAARMELGAGLDALTVAVQGVGNVGAALARLLHQAGARLLIADADSERAQALAAELGAQAIAADEILSAKADVLAPCALGAVLDARTVPLLKAKLVCGGANNQLADDTAADLLMHRGIAYAPDYLVNAGGIINVVAEYMERDEAEVRARIEGIPRRLRQVLATARSRGAAPHRVADEMAEALMARAPVMAA